MTKSETDEESSDIKNSVFSKDIVEYMEISESHYPINLEEAVSAIEATSMTESFVQGCKLCIRILNNILLNPWDQSKRWINSTSNAYTSSIIPHEILTNLLLSLGFKSTEDHIYLNLVSTSRLKRAYDWLITFLKTRYKIHIKSNSNHFFDPYKAYKHSTSDTSTDAAYELTDKDAVARDIMEAKKRLVNIKSVSSIRRDDLELKILQTESNSKDSVNEETTSVDDDNEAPIDSAILRIKNMDRHFQFQSKSKMKLDNLLKCKVHEKSRVQFVISSKEILEMTLPASIKIEQVKLLLKRLGCLNEGRLCIMPLKDELSHGSTLLDLDLVPTCRIHILDSTCNTIDKTLFDNFQQLDFDSS